MSKRNPILSMTSNMWARLRAYHEGHGTGPVLDATGNALRRRGLVKRLMGHTVLTDSGRIAVDSYAEGQEAKA